MLFPDDFRTCFGKKAKKHCASGFIILRTRFRCLMNESKATVARKDDTRKKL